MKAQKLGQEIVDSVGLRLSEHVKTLAGGNGIDLGAPTYRQRIWWGGAQEVMNFPATVRVAVQSEMGSIPQIQKEIDDAVLLELLIQSKYCLFGGFTMIQGAPLCIAGAAAAYDGGPSHLESFKELMFRAICGQAFVRHGLYECTVGDVMHECCGGNAAQSETLASVFEEGLRRKVLLDTRQSDDSANFIGIIADPITMRGYEITNVDESEWRAELKTEAGQVCFNVFDRVDHPWIPDCRLATLTLPFNADDLRAAWDGICNLNFSNQQDSSLEFALGSWSACKDDDFQFKYWQWMPRDIFDSDLAASVCISMANRGRYAVKLLHILQKR
jgi:hypothetical protein